MDQDAAALMNQVIGLTLAYCGQDSMIYDADSLKRLGENIVVQVSLTPENMILVRVVTQQNGRATPLIEES